MIEKDTIEQLRERIDLQAVISRFVDLKKSGANWIGRCPFHDDRSPSFTVPVGKPFFHCFGCNAHGDAIDFLQRQQGLSFADAVRELAAEAGLTVTKRKAKRQPLKATVKFKPAPAAKEGHQELDEVALSRLANWQAQLHQALPYLESRKVPLAVAQAVGAGYLPAGKAMGRNADGKLTGFGPRIVFPHTLPDGRIVNLYGRSTDPAADKKRKHRHLPQAKGLLNAAALTLPGDLWIVEGPFDALALMAAGVQKVIAIFGLDGFDWRWIGKQQLVIATDHDEAGESAAQKMLQEAAYRGLKATRLPAEAFGGEKDAAAALASGVLQIDAYRPQKQVAEGPAGPDRPQKSVAGDGKKVDETLPAGPESPQKQGADIAALVAALGDPPQHHLAERWPQFKALAARFCALHLADALAAGWTLADLFSLPWNRLGADSGAIWVLCGVNVEQITVQTDKIVAEAASGALLAYRRGRVTGVMPWHQFKPWER